MKTKRNETAIYGEKMKTYKDIQMGITILGGEWNRQGWG